MAKLYARKIRNGEMLIADVPIRWRAEVQVILDGFLEDAQAKEVK